jgi:release factor glutamine methyltransferase
LTLNQEIRIAAEKLAQVGIPTARLDAELLLRHILGRDRAWLLAHSNDSLDAAHQRVFENLIKRRGTREPIQHIVGRQEFWGLDFIVTPDVLIPRPETELVVESALREARGMKAPVIVDLCSGSGCIAISLAKELPAARLFATDISEKALAIARENARRHDVSDRIRFFEGDLFGPLEELDLRGRVDMIVSNPPYVRVSELDTLQPEVRDFEPKTALIAGPEGTEIHERIISAAPDYLKRYGALILEMGLGQSAQLVALMRESGRYKPPEVLKDLAGIERVIVAEKL